MGWIGEEGWVGWEGWVEDDHASDGAVQATRSRGGDGISVKTVEHGRERVIISLLEQYLAILSDVDGQAMGATYLCAFS